MIKRFILKQEYPGEGYWLRKGNAHSHFVLPRLSLSLSRKNGIVMDLQIIRHQSSIMMSIMISGSQMII